MQVSNPATGGSLMDQVIGHANRARQIAECTAVIQGMLQHICNITKAFSNIICIMAHVFRIKGYHYLSKDANATTYAQAYTSLWEKANVLQLVLKSTWAHIHVVTAGLHCIAPYPLDEYWLFCAAEQHISPSLQLRKSVPAVGTAALFGLRAGWRDAKTVYAKALSDCATAEAEMETLYVLCIAERSTHGVNAKYYGAEASRLDLSGLTALCGKI